MVSQLQITVEITASTSANFPDGSLRDTHCTPASMMMLARTGATTLHPLSSLYSNSAQGQTTNMPFLIQGPAPSLSVQSGEEACRLSANLTLQRLTLPCTSRDIHNILVLWQQVERYPKPSGITQQRRILAARCETAGTATPSEPWTTNASLSL